MEAQKSSVTEHCRFSSTKCSLAQCTASHSPGTGVTKPFDKGHLPDSSTTSGLKARPAFKTKLLPDFSDKRPKSSRPVPF